MADARYDATRNQYVAGNDAADDVAYTANGAIAITTGVHALAKTSAAAMTLAAPTAAQEGTHLFITARTAFAHTVTIAAGVGAKGAGFTTLTFAVVGDTIHLFADNLHWNPSSAPYGVVIS